MTADERELLLALSHFVLWPPEDSRYKTHNHALQAAHTALKNIERKLIKIPPREFETKPTGGKTSDWAKLSLKQADEIARLETKIQEMKKVGTRLSNIAFNIAEQGNDIRFSEAEVERMKILQEEWDKLVRRE